MPIVTTRPSGAVRLVTTTQAGAKIVFFGTPSFSVQTLRTLVDQGWPVIAVVTAPDRPVGRKKIMTPSPVKVLAQELGLAVYTPETLKDDAFFAWFSSVRPDLGIVVAYNKILPQRYLDIPRLGFVNIHPSLLPAYRGPSPVRSAILEGATQSGTSIMLLDAETDHGPILAQKTWDIPSSASGALCEDELFALGTSMLMEILPTYTQGQLHPIPQDHSRATFTGKFTRQDGKLDWTQPATVVANRVRALGDTPGTWTTWDGKILNIIAAYPIDKTTSNTPGTTSLIDGQLVVACGQGSLAIDSLQLEGSTAQPPAAFVHGHTTFVGAVLGA